MKSLDLEILLKNYNLPQNIEELEYLFKISISLYRQMIFAELRGNLAPINSRIDEKDAQYT